MQNNECEQWARFKIELLKNLDYLWLFKYNHNTKHQLYYLKIESWNYKTLQTLNWNGREPCSFSPKSFVYSFHFIIQFNEFRARLNSINLKTYRICAWIRMMSHFLIYVSLVLRVIDPPFNLKIRLKLIFLQYRGHVQSWIIFFFRIQVNKRLSANKVRFCSESVYSFSTCEIEWDGERDRDVELGKKECEVKHEQHNKTKSNLK